MRRLLAALRAWFADEQAPSGRAIFMLGLDAKKRNGQ